MTPNPQSALSKHGRAALKYATDFGWFVFPCHWPIDHGCSCGQPGCGKTTGKHPLTRNGLKDATTDVVQIAKWFKKNPAANIAIACGSPSGFVTIDVDDCLGKFGSESLENLSETLGGLPSTVEALTGGGGRHLLFAVPRGERISSRVGLAPGIDIRGDGGYIIAPPSLHASGRTYEWEASSRPSEVSIAELPAAWLRALQDRTPGNHTPIEPPNFERLPPGLDRRARAYVAHMDPAISGQGGHTQTFKVTCALIRGLCVTAAVALDILQEYNQRCVPPWSLKELRHKVNSAVAESRLPWGYLLSPAKPDPLPPVDQAKPTIIITTDEPHVVDQSIDALVKADAPLYQRGGMLVRVLRGDTSPRGITHVPDTPTIGILPQPRLREIMAGSANWVTEKQTKDGEIVEVSAHPPLWAVQQVEARGEWKGIRSLHAIVETPVLRPDGSVLELPGHDDATGLIFEPNLPPITVPTEPSQGDAMRSALDLLDVVSDFPFAEPPHKVAWLAACLTPFARYSFAGPSPCILIDATTRGSGKTLLADLISYLVTGREMPRMPQVDGEEERKRITSIALAGFRCVLLDNLTSLGSTALDAALTGTSWAERLLGESRQVVLPLSSCWFATGNNVRLKGDIIRRVLHIRLESQDENPEQRTGFKHPDLIAWIRQERARLVTAALTILRAHAVAGRPYSLAPWGSFEGWSRVVRGAIVYAGLEDPSVTRQALADSSDSDLTTVHDLLEGWQEMADQIGDSRGAMPVSTVVSALKGNPMRYHRLRDALAEIVRVKAGKDISSSDIGYALRKFRGRVVNGKRVVLSSIVRGQKLWIVEPAGQ